MDQGRRPRPTLAKLAKQRPRTLVPGSAEDSSQRKVIEDLSRAGNKEATEAPKADGGCSGDRRPAYGFQRTAPPKDVGSQHGGKGDPLRVPRSRHRSPESGSGGPYDSKRRLRELIGSSGARIPDDSLQNVPFYPSMGAQAVKYYFTPKWEEFSSHEELEDVLEASLASAIRASTLQMKVLGEFRTRMREQKKLVAQSSKADKEHQQAIEGLKAALESALDSL
ncbi:hypothetical protein Adt_23297 [Abeliophyllum distichum]|uniref:Uncharacterized protein n=1 Tax=Abeliophyllum distichum TaxID=126358 RepID=A0ABD1SAI0_9LAMI